MRGKGRLDNHRKKSSLCFHMLNWVLHIIVSRGNKGQEKGGGDER